MAYPKLVSQSGTVHYIAPVSPISTRRRTFCEMHFHIPVEETASDASCQWCVAIMAGFPEVAKAVAHIRQTEPKPTPMRVLGYMRSDGLHPLLDDTFFVQFIMKEQGLF